MAKRLLDPINVRLSPQLRKRLDELGKERGESMAVLIREALNEAYRPEAVRSSGGQLDTSQG